MDKQEQADGVQVPMVTVIDGYLTESQACKILNCHRTTAYRMREAGKLGYLTIGNRIRYTLAHIQDYQRRNGSEATK